MYSTVVYTGSYLGKVSGNIVKYISKVYTRFSGMSKYSIWIFYEFSVYSTGMLLS